MATERLAHLECVSQLFISQIRDVHKRIGKAWYELELARDDLRELIEAHEYWEKESRLNPGLREYYY